MTIRKTPRTNLRRVRRPGRHGPGRTLGVLATALLLLAASTARADLVLTIVVPDAEVAPGSAASFDVTLQNASTSTQDVTVGGFNIDIRLADTSRVTFTDINSMTALPYIFSTTGSFGFLGSVLGGGIEVTGNDLALPPLNGVTIAPGQSFGLAHVSYQVAANAAPGAVSVPLVDLGTGTLLADENGVPIDFGTTNGTITIPGVAVPEPGSMAKIALCVVVALIGSRKSSRAPRA